MSPLMDLSDDVCPSILGGLVSPPEWKTRAPKFLRICALRFWEDRALIPFRGIIGGYVPLYLRGIVPPPLFPIKGCMPPNSGRSVPLSPLEDASLSILGGTVPPPPFWTGHVPLNSGRICPCPL